MNPVFLEDNSLLKLEVLVDLPRQTKQSLGLVPAAIPGASKAADGGYMGHLGDELHVMTQPPACGQ